MILFREKTPRSRSSWDKNSNPARTVVPSTFDIATGISVPAGESSWNAVIVIATVFPSSSGGSEYR